MKPGAARRRCGSWHRGEGVANVRSGSIASQTDCLLWGSSSQAHHRHRGGGSYVACHANPPPAYPQGLKAAANRANVSGPAVFAGKIRGEHPVMRVTIERSAFLKALNHVQSVVERRNTIPILSNVLIQAAGGTVKLTATDLDIEIVESVAGRSGARRRHHGARPHALRHRAQAARRRPARNRTGAGPGRVVDLRRALALCPAGVAARGFSRS